MNAHQAIDWVDADKWRKTSAREKLELLKTLQKRIKEYQSALYEAELTLHKIDKDDPSQLHRSGYARIAPIGIAKNVAICIEVYESLVKGEMPKPMEVKKVGDGLYDAYVFPHTKMDKLLNGNCHGYIRVRGEPKQVSPLDKEGGITAILGAGNFTSAFEMIRALFMENCVIVFKSPRINLGVDAIWEEVFEPLIEYRAVSYCHPDYGHDLVKDSRLKNIYLTGGVPAAKAILNSTDIPLISELGGNNPALIVPGNRPWTKEEIAHQAQAIVSGSKMNGGAVCGRLQTIVTSKNWPQRREFLDALETAIRDETPAFINWYPGTDKNLEGFKNAYPEAKVIKPEGGKLDNSEFVLIEGAETDGYATKHEAFCQVLAEVPLDSEPTVKDFLEKAVSFCNDDLLGTLGCSIIVDDGTLEENRVSIERAVTDLRYGAVAINQMPFSVGATFWLTWGGNEEGKELASGRGNFGNPMGLENTEKSILYCPFMSPTHLMFTNKKLFHDQSIGVINHAIEPTWFHFAALVVSSLACHGRKRDF
ncbi:MAG: aldehyde dehydrogenase family protein [Verrucomicrobiaceae bacterium]|nr:aldehyde dehydrogenase family protein [Verrucomicrobiaceae bacterium]